MGRKSQPPSPPWAGIWAGSGQDRVSFPQSSLYGAVFWSAAKPVLTAHQGFSYCWKCLHSIKAFSFLHSAFPQWEGWQWARSWERTLLGQLVWTGQKDIPCCVTSCQQQNWGRKKGIFLKTLLPSEWLDNGLFMGHGEWFTLHCLWRFLSCSFTY